MSWPYLPVASQHPDLLPREIGPFDQSQEFNPRVRDGQDLHSGADAALKGERGKRARLEPAPKERKAAASSKPKGFWVPTTEMRAVVKIYNRAKYQPNDLRAFV